MSIPGLTRENIVVIFAIPQNWPVRLGLLSEHDQLFLRPDAFYNCILVDPAGQFCLLVYKNPPFSFVFTQVLKCCCFAEGFGFSLHYEQMTLQKAPELSSSLLLTGPTNRIGGQ